MTHRVIPKTRKAICQATASQDVLSDVPDYAIQYEKESPLVGRRASLQHGFSSPTSNDLAFSDEQAREPSNRDHRPPATPG